MYTPSKFKIEDPERIRSFIEENSFGLLLSIEGDCIHDTLTPFVLAEDGRRLLGHVARANPQGKSWEDGTQVKVIFTGAHSYISPHYYESTFAVPTWNYTAVSMTGRITLIKDEDEVLQFLDRLVAKHESAENPWVLDRTDERYLGLLSGIMVFSVSMDSVEASFKLNQNKSEEDQRKVIASLGATGCPMESELARLMAENLEVPFGDGN